MEQITPNPGLIPIAAQQITSLDEIYKLVDLLNKTLKHDNLMFGLRKDLDAGFTITVYRV